MKLAQQQRGMTAIGIALIVVLVGILVLIAIKLIPVYLENYQIKSVLSSLQKERDLAKEPPREIWSAMSRRMAVNDITAIGREDVVIQKTGDGVLITVDYEARRSLFGNVDLVATFHNEASIP